MSDSDDDGDSRSSSIRIYLRIRPSKRPSNLFDLDPEAGKVQFRIPVEKQRDMINNTRTQFNFKFDGCLMLSQRIFSHTE